MTAEGKAIYMVSDGTGWTAEHSVNAALGQFEYCLVDHGCPVNTHLFSGVCSSFSFSTPQNISLFVFSLIFVVFDNFSLLIISLWRHLVDVEILNHGIQFKQV